MIVDSHASHLIGARVAADTDLSDAASFLSAPTLS